MRTRLKPAAHEKVTDRTPPLQTGGIWRAHSCNTQKRARLRVQRAIFGGRTRRVTHSGRTRRVIHNGRTRRVTHNSRTRRVIHNGLTACARPLRTALLRSTYGRSAGCALVASVGAMITLWVNAPAARSISQKSTDRNIGRFG